MTRFGAVLALCVGGLLSGCRTPSEGPPTPRPDISPRTRTVSGAVLRLDAGPIAPLHQELLPVDLPTVVRVAEAENFDVRMARAMVESREGQYERTVGAAFPAIVPTALFEWVDGTVRATPGDLVDVGFTTFQPALAVQWIINPGQVYYEIVAARKQVQAEADRERAVVMETLRRSAVEYYDLVLAQARVGAAQQAVTEAQELLRITRVRLRTGTGVSADELRAEARLAERRQDLAIALNQFYEASVALSLTLALDARVTLVPAVRQVAPAQLLRTDLELDDLLAFAVQHRPDLRSVRRLAEAVADQTHSTWWSVLGLSFKLGYRYGGITGHADNVDVRPGFPSALILNPASPTGAFAPNPVVNGAIREGLRQLSVRSAPRKDKTFGFHDQQRATIGASGRWSLSAFGDLKTAKAEQRRAALQAERRLSEVQAEVIRAAQSSDTHAELIDLAGQQIEAAREALRLTQANLEAGAMTTLDVLQSQEAAAQARLRYAAAVIRYNQSQVNLLASLGLIDAQTLNWAVEHVPVVIPSGQVQP